MNSGVFSQIIGLGRQRPVLCAILAAHVFFLYEYYTALWQKTHYQFFPLALIAFLALFATRRADEPERWTWLPKGLLALGLLALPAALVLKFGFGRSHPLLAVVGFVTLLTAWVAANRDAGYDRRLTYLSILPWMTVRLPLNYDEEVIHWLQRLTTSAASKALHRVEMLHYRDGNILQFPTKSFMVEEACSGVQSLFTIVFLAAFVLCLRRRSLVHGVLMLAAGVLFAGIMNTLRVVTIAYAWDSSGLDLSAGWRHESLGYAYLLVAALLLLSADAFLAFFTDSVPDVRRPGPVGLFLNPLILLWNRLVAVSPSRRTPVTELKPVASSAGQESADRRSWPTTGEVLRPSNFFHFNFGLIESWTFSRNYRQLFGGMPFFLISAGCVGLFWWLRHASIEPVVAQYEKTYNDAVKADDSVRQEYALRALDSLRASEPQYRFRLAQFMLEEGRTEDGLREILRLAPENAQGLIEARMWLVQQAASPKPLMPMTSEQIETQLKKVLNQSAQHLQAHMLLASLYQQRKETRLAEFHLGEAARINPEANFELAILKRELNRDPNSVKEIAMKAVEAWTARLQKNREDSKARVKLAETLLLAGQDVQAREVLVAGVLEGADPTLNTAISNLDMMNCAKRLRESPLNRDACLPVVLSAMNRDPSGQIGVRLLLQLRSMGAEISPDSVVSSVTHWQKKVDESPDDTQARFILSQLKLVSGEPLKAAAIFRPVVTSDPVQAIPLSNMLVQAGEVDEAARVLEPVMSDCRIALEKDPADLVAVARLAESLVILKRGEEARALLIALSENSDEKRIPENPVLSALYGQACLLQYDQLTGYSSESPLVRGNSHTGVDVPADLDIPLALELLVDATNCQATIGQAIDRIARLSLSSHAAASCAEDLVRQLRLEGDYGAKILNHVGTHALILKRFDKAKGYLEQANAQTRGRDPMILNNLATCIIRGGGDTKDRALSLANETLALLPDNSDALSTRAEVYIAMERWQDAVTDLTLSLNLRKNNPEVHRLLEKAYEGLQETEMAKEHGRRAMELESAQAKN